MATSGTASITHPYARKRMEFGRPSPIQQGPDGRPWVTPAKVEDKSWTMFQDRGMAPEIIEDLFPEEQVAEENFIERTPCTGQVQCAPDLSEREVRCTPCPTPMALPSL